jgi:hypothetical protein
MTDVAARSVISLELDDTNLQMDAAATATVMAEFFARMQAAANITPTIDMAALAATGRHIIRLPVDPDTTTAGLEVVQELVREYAARFRREGHVAVGVDTQPVHTAMSRLRDFTLHTARSIGDGIYFWISRGLLKAGRDMAMILPRFFKASFDKALEAEESSKKLAKALGATGEQAGKSHEELAAYARDLEKITNISNETVQGVQALLAPSKGLSGINFDRATKGALDLAAALGGDINSHAERLSKSLQDPVRGMEMLRDAGISFTQEQQDIIKLFAETNQVGAAQGIMLDELESRYLGAADATGDLTDKVKQAELHYENFKERVGEVVLDMKQEFIPAIDAAMLRLDEVTPIAAGAAMAMSNIALSILSLKEATDEQGMSLDETIAKTSEWASSLEAAYGGVSNIADNALSNINDYLLLIAQLPGLGMAALSSDITAEDITGDNSEIDMFGSKARTAKRAEEIEQAAIERREKKKKQDLLDAQQRKDDALKRKADQEKEIALGTGLVTEAEIKEKGAKQAIKDAKEKQRLEHKALLAKAAADKKAAEDKERADRRAARDKESADEKAARDAKKAAREKEAADEKAARDKKRAADKAQADYERSLGRDSLMSLHDRIQDAALMQKKAFEEKVQVTTAANVAPASKIDVNKAMLEARLKVTNEQADRIREQIIEKEEAAAALNGTPGGDYQEELAAQLKLKLEGVKKEQKRLQDEIGLEFAPEDQPPGRMGAALGMKKPTAADREAAKQKALMDEFMPNTMSAASALGRTPQKSQAQRDAEAKAKLEEQFGIVGGKAKLEVKQDDVVKAVSDTEKAINEMSTNVVRAIKEPQKMGK